ncbi:hypothetical protein ABH944_006281 [Caballeronia udeis]|uniref:Uncharacterized protein n=1 Tax=Caballeronia udeis TaxID=1232866 RepID=A0ABW8MUF0_9BURK
MVVFAALAAEYEYVAAKRIAFEHGLHFRSETIESGLAAWSLQVRQLRRRLPPKYLAGLPSGALR